MCSISVIVPVYNCEKYISRCIDSILNQTFKDFEILLLNDGSTDNSLKILREYEKKHKNIIVIDKKNEGVAITRNKGIKLAKGKYIAFIDNDDYIDKDYLRRHYDVATINDFDVVLSGYKKVNKNKNILFKYKIKNTPWAKYQIVAPWARLYKKSFIIRYNIKFFPYTIGEDVIFNLNLYSNNPKVSVINYCGYNWFNNNDSISNTLQKKITRKNDISVLFEKILSNTHIDEYTKYYLYRYKVWYLLYAGRNSKPSVFIEENIIINKILKSNSITKIIKPFSIKLKGEKWKDRIIVFIFMLIELLHLDKIFAKIYCNGK